MGDVRRPDGWGAYGRPPPAVYTWLMDDARDLLVESFNGWTVTIESGVVKIDFSQIRRSMTTAGWLVGMARELVKEDP